MTPLNGPVPQDPDAPQATDDVAPVTLQTLAARRETALGHLRVQEPQFRDSSFAPEVDCDLIRALVQRKLGADDAKLVHRLIVSCESWKNTHNQILVEEFRSHTNAD